MGIAFGFCCCGGDCETDVEDYDETETITRTQTHDGFLTVVYSHEEGLSPAAVGSEGTFAAILEWDFIQLPGRPLELFPDAISGGYELGVGPVQLLVTFNVNGSGTSVTRTGESALSHSATIKNIESIKLEITNGVVACGKTIDYDFEFVVTWAGDPDDSATYPSGSHTESGSETIDDPSLPACQKFRQLVEANYSSTEDSFAAHQETVTSTLSADVTNLEKC